MKNIKIIRDQSGIKPLFWYHKNGVFLHANNLKEIISNPKFQKELDLDSVALFLQYGFIPEPYCIFKYTHKLKAGHSLIYNPETDSIKIEKYWDILDLYKKPKYELSDKDAIELTDLVMRNSYEKSFNNDILNSGVLLSGGYDSTSVAALLQTNRSEQIKTFSIGFYENDYNEAHHAKDVATHIGTDHTEYYCTQNDALELLPKIPDILEEPMGDASIIPTTMATLLASQSVSRILSADGADELLGGYDKYIKLNKKNSILNKFPNSIIPASKFMLNSWLIRSLLDNVGVYDAESRLSKLQDMLGSTNQEIFKISSQQFTNSCLEKLLLFKYTKKVTNYDITTNLDWPENLLITDFKTNNLDAVLVKVNRAASFSRIENIEPILDLILIEHFVRLKPNLKIRNNSKKFILKEVVHKYVPSNIMDRPKKGFGVPLTKWFKDDLKTYLLDYLDETTIKNTGLFNPDYVIKLRDRYLNGSNESITKLWYLLVFQLWYEKWMK